VPRRPNRQNVTRMKDIADDLGLSVVAVSKVFHNHPDIGEKTRERTFGFTKVRYRGIGKNHQWLCVAFALVNLYQHRNRLAPQRA
jgi:IS5 family transposase